MSSPTGFHHFGDVATAYTEGRPSVSDEVADFLFDALPSSPTVVEVGSGTGQLTRALVGRSARLVCLEPDDRLRATLVDRLPDTVEVQGRTLEASAIPPGSVDLLVASGAWHWVDPSLGATTAARALRPEGLLAVMWNYTELVGALRGAIHGGAFTGRFAKFRTTCARVRVVADRSRRQLVDSGQFTLAATRFSTRASSADPAGYESLIRSFGCAKHHSADELDDLAATVRGLICVQGLAEVPLAITSRVDLFQPSGRHREAPHELDHPAVGRASTQPED